MSKSSTLVNEASLYVQQLLLEQLPTTYLYHNYDHAEEVVDVCKTLAKAANLSEKESEVLQLAAWFQGCGYTRQGENLAQASVAIAREFLENKEFPEKRIEKVASLIQNLHQDQPPKGDLDKLLQDAYNSFVGRKRFFRRGRLLRLEKEALQDTTFTLHEWNQRLLEMLISHRFYTPWAQEQYSKRLNKNIVSQRANILKSYTKTTRKKTGKDFGRGVDTLYRVTLRNHLNLSRIADGKANMIISINTLVLSILITAGAAGFSFEDFSFRANLRYAIPILLLMATSLAAIIFAVLSAIPKVSGNTEGDEEARSQASMLFFSNFLTMKKADFVQHLRELKKDQELLYDDLSKDLYNLGGVLQAKYRLLTVAYRVFVGGLVLSFLVFMILLFF